ncbi:MAG: SUF system NifU family Fe-S cluster assembly protein [bacterium]|nr:SUF system NifU family Fe-S cluster assembly protein [bacterium]
MDLYSDIILDHYQHPRHAGALKHPSVHVAEHNPLCGDTIQLDVAITHGKVADVGFVSSGCAISQAAMSMLSENIIGKHVEEINALSNDSVFSLLQVPISPARVKCALLGLAATKHALAEYERKK